MNVVLYLDVYFSINFLMDLTAILLSAYVSGEKPRLWRVLLASFLGSLVACLGVVFSLDGIVLIIFGVLFFLPMKRKNLLRFVSLHLYTTDLPCQLNERNRRLNVKFHYCFHKRKYYRCFLQCQKATKMCFHLRLPLPYC